ncbi:hypothetical protein QBC41DRAFT_330468 [Cercophora samala]|uniref:Uncharacterized protein n=1 Tax=Cercophora samala TaxID=330535 RepID=A0AA40D4A8_9PEZI|nr:hypothetical protein QBC41DRAFT_330468 [Cercophora samala]
MLVMSPPLLRISPELRQLIYLFTGVAPWSRQERFIFDLHGPPHGEQVDEDFELHPQFRGLLLCCRAIYQEVAALLYSSNAFILYSATGSFGPILALTPTALASLTHLKIVINSQTACHIKTSRTRTVQDCCLASRDFCAKRHAHQPALRTSVSSDRDLLDQWHSAAAHLSKITAGQLSLFLVCDVDPTDSEAARLAVEPFSMLPPLKECHLRLGERPNPHLQHLARETVSKALGAPATIINPSPSSFSRFLMLPRELRLRILCYTDLVTPIKEVSWDGDGYRADRPDHRIAHEAGTNWGTRAPCRRDHHHGCQFGRCWLRSSENYLVGCFCSINHTAVSSTCRCWAPPTDLFLVCKSLYDEAQHVFFSQNRFIIHDLPRTGPPSEDSILQGTDYPNSRLRASSFLGDKLSLSNLASLRFLELAFPAYGVLAWPDDHHPAINDWQRTLIRVKDHINGPSLTVRVVMAAPRESLSRGDLQGVMDCDPNRTPVVVLCHNIITPISYLTQGNNSMAPGPLHRFYAHMAYNHWDGFTSRGDDDNENMEWWRSIKQQQKHAKELAERVVLGKEGYERQQRCGDGEETDTDEDRDGKEEDEEFGGFNPTPEVSEEILEKSLKEWDREQREGKEPTISYWLFQEMLDATDG